MTNWRQASSSPWVCPIIIKFYSVAILGILVIDVMNMQSFFNKLNKMSISNINKYLQMTIGEVSYFRSVLYGEDIIMELSIYLSISF